MNRNSQNLQHHLLARESNLYPGRRHPIPSNFLFHERNLYKSITPRLTVQNVDKPHGYMRKFSPNGKHLIVFTQDQKSVDVFQYLGVGNASELLNQQRNECITAADNSLLSLNIRQELFKSLFKLQYQIRIITTVPSYGRHNLNMEFSLFLDSGNFVLLASAASGSIFPNYLYFEEYVELYDSTELYDYTFYLIDLRKGTITDTIKMPHDCLVLNHNHCISFFECTVAILSTYRQCIEIFVFDAVLGKLIRSRTIGPFLSEIDRDCILSHLVESNFTIDPSHDLPLSHLKQKILVYMYREILDIDSPDDRRFRLKEFHKNFQLYERMIIFKMQLIDSSSILIRYDKRPSQEPEPYNPNDRFRIYVFYNTTHQQILRIFESSSVELLRLIRNCNNDFRNSYSLFVPWQSSSQSDSDHFRKVFDRLILSYAGGLIEAAVHFNTTVPINTQSFATSPYLDYSLFEYDDRFISILERPKRHSQEPIKFLDRHTKQLKFRVFLEQPSDARNQNLELDRNHRDMVSYIFHPYEPFIISIQKLHSRYVTNFHLYSTNVVPKE